MCIVCKCVCKIVGFCDNIIFVWWGCDCCCVVCVVNVEVDVFCCVVDGFDGEGFCFDVVGVEVLNGCVVDCIDVVFVCL